MMKRMEEKVWDEVEGTAEEIKKKSSMRRRLENRVKKPPMN